MNYTINNNVNFKGYDAIKLRGFYMQGLISAPEKRIFNEMKQIATREGLDLFINQNNKKISRNIANNIKKDNLLSIWGQDRKAFVKKGNTPTILWNAEETLLNKGTCNILGNYAIESKRAFPRGGNYYIGYKDNGEKWLLMNSIDVYDEDTYKKWGDLPTARMLPEIFDIKPENIYYIKEFFRDLDDSIRPIGYPFVLVNDYNETAKNIEKLEKKFPNSNKIITRLKEHIPASMDCFLEDKIRTLQNHGFIPIRIGALYEEGINFINALAFKNNNDNISYITNSTKGSYPELEYLERLFEEDIKQKVPNLEHIYFVSGGKPKQPAQTSSVVFRINFSHGFDKDNAIMDILADRHGGIHCMTAEIPDFDNLA